MSYERKMGQRIKELMTMFRGQTFYSPEQVNMYIQEMLVEVASFAYRELNDGEEVKVTVVKDDGKAA